MWGRGEGQLLPWSIVVQVENILCYLLSLREVKGYTAVLARK